MSSEFKKLVVELLYSWQNSSEEQVEAWANGETWNELEKLYNHQVPKKFEFIPNQCVVCESETNGMYGNKYAVCFPCYSSGELFVWQLENQLKEEG